MTWKKNMKRPLIAGAICLSHGFLLAQDASSGDARPFSFLLGAGLTYGGETLATAVFTDGSTRTIKAGNLFVFKVGADWRINPNVSLQGTLGLHIDTVTAENGKMSFDRNFLEGLAFWNTTPGQRLGVGLRKTAGARLTSSGVASTVGNVEFTSSFGAVVEYEWLSRPDTRGFGITLRYVAEKYTP